MISYVPIEVYIYENIYFGEFLESVAKIRHVM